MRHLFLAAVMVFIPTHVWAKVTVEQTDSRYELRGLTKEEIHSDIMKNAPKENGEIIDGEMNDDLTLSLDYTVQAGKCQIASDTVNLKLVMSLPRWVDEQRASEKVRTAWNEYFSVLQAHESGHKEIAVRAANEIDKLIHSGQSAESCSELKARITTAAEGIQSKAEAAQEKHDKNSQSFDLVEE